MQSRTEESELHCYLKDLEEFEKKTIVEDFICACSSYLRVPPEFTEDTDAKRLGEVHCSWTTDDDGDNEGTQLLCLLGSSCVHPLLHSPRCE